MKPPNVGTWLPALFLLLAPVAFAGEGRDPAEPIRPVWPPKGEAIRLPVVRDNWVSTVGKEAEGNNGGSSRLKLKGQQEFALFDVDASRLKGRIVTGALWHFRSADPRQPALRVTVSTVATPWVEGTGTDYQPQAGSSCFNQAELGKRDWAYPGSTLADAAFGRGRTIWRFAEASKPDPAGWQSCAVAADVVAARVAGLSEGFAVWDDVGSIWSYRNGEFRYTYFPNRFLYSHRQAASAPWLEVWTEATDGEPPEAVQDLTAETADLPAGEALIRWKTPPGCGRSGTFGFNVTYTARAQELAVPRYLIPFAGKPGEEVLMHLQDIPFSPGQEILLTIRPVDAAGNVGAPFRKAIRVSANPRVFPIAKSVVEPYHPSDLLPEVNGLKVAVVDLLDKVHPQTGAMTPPHPAGYLGGNHIWSAQNKLIRLFAARNEAVCFQVVLFGVASDARVALDFPQDGGLSARTYRLHAVQTGAGPMPDAAVPLEGALAIPCPDDPEAAGQKNASLLCEIYVAHNEPAGLKRGTLVITSAGKTLALEVILNVWNFTLPDKLSFIPEMNCYGTAGPEGIGLEYYRLAHEHRCCLNRLYYHWRGDAEYAPTWNGEDFDWEPWDRRFGPLLDGDAFRDLPRRGEPVDTFYLPFNENWPINLQANYSKNYWADEAFTPRYRAELQKAFAAFAAHCNAKRWCDSIFEFYLNNKVYYKQEGWSRCSAPWIFDEPVDTQDFWALRWYGILFHQATAAVCGDAQMWFRGDISYGQYARNILSGVLDLEVIGGATAQKIRMKRDEQALYGRNYFMEYGSANDPKDANTQPVVWSLNAWSQGAIGVVPWQTIATPDAWHKGEATGLLYPAAKSVVASVRLKAFRRGQQDVEYLTLLGEAYGQSHDAVAGGAARLLNELDRVAGKDAPDSGLIRLQDADPVTLWRLRTAVGGMISDKKPPYKRCVRPMPSPESDLGRLADAGYVPVAPSLPSSAPE